MLLTYLTVVAEMQFSLIRNHCRS